MILNLNKMKIRCISKTGKSLRPYEYDLKLKKSVFGRFGASEDTEYNQLDIGKEYLVMGIIVFQTYQAYLIDGDGIISACPCQLFEIIDRKLSPNWYFRSIDNNENIYPFVQSIFGYLELCSDKNAYENLILENNTIYENLYFNRKMEMELELSQNRK
jgi:hypothetical protein